MENDFSVIDAQDEISRLAQMVPIEFAPETDFEVEITPE